MGKLLNTSDELGSAAAISSDNFKAIITGDPFTARDVYTRSATFHPEAQHVFAANQLPSFQGGMDRGVLRRLLVVPFNRTIPREERVDHIGQRIVEEELGLVLAWAVDGAARLLARGYFLEPAGSSEAVREWAEAADPVLGWLEERVCVVVGAEAPRLESRKAYDDFQEWAHAEGYSQHSLPKMNNFVERVQAATARRGAVRKHSGSFRGFVGMMLKSLKPAQTEVTRAAA